MHYANPLCSYMCTCFPTKEKKKKAQIFKMH